MLYLKPLHRALALALGTTTAAWTVHAQTAEPARVEITGSSIKRIQGETALPVQVLNAEDIQRSGVSSVEQLLKTVTASATLGGTSVANTGAGGGQGGGNSVSLLSLRGLGSARTLVLINGRRGAPAGGSSAVDIAGIPISAIERVEVLKDGASAASLLWFTALGYGARGLAPLFARPRAWQILDALIGMTMLALAAGLASRF